MCRIRTTFTPLNEDNFIVYSFFLDFVSCLVMCAHQLRDTIHHLAMSAHHSLDPVRGHT